MPPAIPDNGGSWNDRVLWLYKEKKEADKAQVEQWRGRLGQMAPNAVGKTDATGDVAVKRTEETGIALARWPVALGRVTAFGGLFLLVPLCLGTWMPWGDPIGALTAPSATIEEEEEEEEKTEGEDSPPAEEEEAKDEEAEMKEPGEGDVPEEDVPVESERSVEEEPPSEEEGGAAPAEKKKHIIGATAVLMEKKSELLFRARIDSGAKSCSLHIEEMIIEDEAEKWRDNVGKLVKFRIKNGKNETWMTEKIDGYVIIKTSDTSKEGERRYKVPLTFVWKDMEKTVLVTLNNREKMEYPLLIGRNFLRGDFLIDVDLDNDDDK